MNPLSSLRQVLPGLNPAPLPNPTQSIPATDLAKLAKADSIPRLIPASSPGVTDAIGPARAAGSTGFADTLDQLVQQVNEKQNAAADAVRSLQIGQNTSLHQTMIAMEEASISFQLMVETRNKVLESYQELMRMQI
jgi:flagellar hook-basal body complex protein FliE